MWLAIDSEGTRIREDAFRVRSLPDGRWLVEVSSPAVADVVPLDGVLDCEARDRVSVTARGGARRGMFPRSVESELSFAPGFSGPVLVVAFTLDSDAQTVLHVDARRDTICEGGVAALSYEDGDRLLATCADHNPAYHSLAVAHGLAQQMARAETREVGTQSIVAEIMTAANVAATTWAHDRGLLLIQDKAGHYGVAEPTFGRHGQVTNPLRRYASLANQRIILAEFDGRPAVYSADRLAGLGRALGQSSPDLAYSSTSPPRGGRRTAIERRIATDNASSNLQDDRWREALYADTRNGPPSEGTVAAFRSRRVRGLLSWHDFDLLLHAGEQWRDLREEMVPWMRSERPDIVHELLKNLALRADASVEFEFTRPQDPITTAACACRVLLNGYATEWSVLDSEPWMDRPVIQARKGARHNAAWMAVEALLGQREYRDIAEDPVFSHPISDLGFDGPPSMFKNLAYRASQANAPMPAFETVDVSPDGGTPLFRCTATGLGHTAVGEGYRRGAARERAAYSLLNMIRAADAVPGLQVGA
ncbi:RNB domain-containing ribonuclease [Rhodococcus hoagii]|nr:RNB domain-containing ribonuclease [Prescottella equi]